MYVTTFLEKWLTNTNHKSEESEDMGYNVSTWSKLRFPNWLIIIYNLEDIVWSLDFNNILAVSPVAYLEGIKVQPRKCGLQKVFF